MNQKPSGWDRYEQALDEGPWQTAKVWGCSGLILIAVLVLVSWGLSLTCGTMGNAVQTAHQQFDPSVLLAKYEWFKDAYAALSAKRATLKVYEQRLAHLEKAYGVNRRDWPEAERERADLWETEQAGIAASYNSLAAEYNSQMAKFNYRFTNRGDLPAGADDPLPREVAPYLTTDRSN